MKPYSIKFPVKRERTGYRKGPRFRFVVDCSGLEGARFCAAKMINGAMLYRDEKHVSFDVARAEFSRRIARLGMRLDALWARVFAGQIDQKDPRIDAASDERRALVNQYCDRAA